MRGFLFITVLFLVAVVAAEENRTNGINSQHELFTNGPTSSELTASARLLDPEYSWLFETLHTRFRFENDGTGIKEVIARIQILSEAGVLQWPELSFSYIPSRQRLHPVYVRILRHDGNVINVDTDPIPNPHRIFREGSSSGFDFYERTVTLPSLSPGDSIEYDVEIVSYAAETPGNFFEAYSFSPRGVLDEQLEIDVPTDRTVKLKMKPGLQNSVKIKNHRRVYCWRMSHVLRDFEGERAIASNSSQVVPDVQISSFQGWVEVGRWYTEMESSRRVPSLEVKAEAEKLTVGLRSDSEKVAALYNFVSEKIKYLSLVSFGIGGYEPHTAEAVLRLGYGDCKDKDTLLGALLEAEGMRSSSVLINPIRELDPDMPSPWPFTHVFTMLRLGKEELWMDSSSGLPFRTLPASLWNKKALVIPLGGTAYFEDLPETPIPGASGRSRSGHL